MKLDEGVHLASAHPRSVWAVSWNRSESCKVCTFYPEIRENTFRIRKLAKVETASGGAPPEKRVSVWRFSRGHGKNGR